MFVCLCVSVTVAPGSTPPLGSFTVPRIEPVSTCAAAQAATKTERDRRDRNEAKVLHGPSPAPRERFHPNPGGRLSNERPMPQESQPLSFM